MDILISLWTVLFIIFSVLLIIIILLQSDKSAGLGILGGSSQTAFGSSTADVITKITTVMVALFMLSSLGLAILQSYKTSSLEKEFLDNNSKTSILSEEKAEGDKNNISKAKNHEEMGDK